MKRVTIEMVSNGIIGHPDIWRFISLVEILHRFGAYRSVSSSTNAPLHEAAVY